MVVVSELNKNVLAEQRIWRKKVRIGGFTYHYSPPSPSVNINRQEADLLMVEYNVSLNSVVQFQVSFAIFVASPEFTENAAREITAHGVILFSL